MVAHFFCCWQNRILNKAEIEQWLDDYQALVVQHHVPASLQDNADETMLQVTVAGFKLITRADGPKPVLPHDEKEPEHVTLLLCVSADGDHCRPLIIYPRKTLPDLSDDLMREFLIAGQPKGWMDSNIFQHWVTSFYIPSVQERRRRHGLPADQKAIFVYDGASTHGAIPVDLLLANHIIPVQLPAHSSALLQPLDLSVNGQLKKLLASIWKSLKGEPLAVRRNRLLGVAWECLEVALAHMHVQTGWRMAGLSPFNKAIPLGKAMFDKENVAPASPAPKKPKSSPLIAGGAIFDGGVVQPLPPVPIIAPPCPPGVSAAVYQDAIRIVAETLAVNKQDV